MDDFFEFEDYADYPTVEDEIASLGLSADLAEYLKENPESDANEYWSEYVEAQNAERDKWRAIHPAAF